MSQLNSIPKKFKFVAGAMIFFIAIYISLPTPDFKDPYATILTGKSGELLGAHIADDEQWRFPGTGEIPEKYRQALLTYEDEHFFLHPGFNPFSFVRALYQNISARRVVSGGSTITMQVVRLSRKGKPRTLWEKLVEVALATKLEFKYSKKQILELYASHAPFGGNVVGLKAASWRYFGRSADQISWGEAALLAVLPNQPGLIHPGKNRSILIRKRNALLKKLFDRKIIDELTFQLAQTEELADSPHPIPQAASHYLMTNLLGGYKGKHIQSDIDHNLQDGINQILTRHHTQHSRNGIYNAAALVIDVRSGNVQAYIGNTSNVKDEHGSDVDVIRAPRSSGSIFKPLLYASMLDEGLILPASLIPDVPVLLRGFAPQNYSGTYDGAVPANRALSRSLNIPAVHMLEEYGVPKFHHRLNQLGLSTINYPASHYGLSLILGGAECTLWDITQIYREMATTLNRFHEDPSFKGQDYPLSGGAIWHTFQAMSEVNRPDTEGQWEIFGSTDQIAWKTGTSFGFRDAWAVGVTPGFAVGVWVGNADGEGRPGLVGVKTAAPILFEIFDKLPSSGWFRKPEADLVSILTCKQSGEAAGEHCDERVLKDVPLAGTRATSCPYHHAVHLDKDERFRVNSSCMALNEMTTKNWFVLPAVQEWYFKSKNADYRVLPPYRADCRSSSALASIDLIYPKPSARILIPTELNGKTGSAVFEAAHRNPKTGIFWHLDHEYIGQTRRIHQMPISPGPGEHILTLVDENGESLIRSFEVLPGKTAYNH